MKQRNADIDPDFTRGGTNGIIRIKKEAKVESKFALQVYNPCGTIEVANVHVPRLETLSGKTIGEISDGIWEADRTFSEIRESLKKRFPDLKIIPYSEFPIGQIDIEDIGDKIKEKGCHAVIVGNAA